MVGFINIRIMKREKGIETLQRLSDTDLKDFVRLQYKSLCLLGVSSENIEYLDDYTRHLVKLYQVAFKEMKKLCKK